MNYQQQAIAGMNPVELIVALYDGMARFLYQAIGAVENRDAGARRLAIGRVLAILMHLQSRLRPDVGGIRPRRSRNFTRRFSRCVWRDRGWSRRSGSGRRSAVSAMCAMRGASPRTIRRFCASWAKAMGRADGWR
jgi:Flagellar protein FliS